MAIAPVIPVVVVPDVAAAVDIARALVAGGIRVIEVTMRTPAALDAIAAIADQVDDICVGAGTVWTAEQADQAISAGSEFLVSPGITDAVGEICEVRDTAYLPGAQTISEIAHLQRRGAEAVKLFPAATIGGPSTIKRYASVFPDMAFCPTGGISAADAADYLALPSVPCVGGSWIVDGDAVAAGDWGRVRDAAANALALGKE